MNPVCALFPISGGEGTIIGLHGSPLGLGASPNPNSNRNSNPNPNTTTNPNPNTNPNTNTNTNPNPNPKVRTSVVPSGHYLVIFLSFSSNCLILTLTVTLTCRILDIVFLCSLMSFYLSISSLVVFVLSPSLSSSLSLSLLLYICLCCCHCLCDYLCLLLVFFLGLCRVFVLEFLLSFAGLRDSNPHLSA